MHVERSLLHLQLRAVAGDLFPQRRLAVLAVLLLTAQMMHRRRDVRVAQAQLRLVKADLVHAVDEVLHHVG